MLIELSVKTPLADEYLADQVLTLWDTGITADDLVPIAWFFLVTQTYWVM